MPPHQVSEHHLEAISEHGVIPTKTETATKVIEEISLKIAEVAANELTVHNGIRLSSSEGSVSI